MPGGEQGPVRARPASWLDLCGEAFRPGARRRISGGFLCRPHVLVLALVGTLVGRAAADEGGAVASVRSGSVVTVAAVASGRLALWRHEGAELRLAAVRRIDDTDLQFMQWSRRGGQQHPDVKAVLRRTRWTPGTPTPAANLSVTVDGEGLRLELGDAARTARYRLRGALELVDVRDDVVRPGEEPAEDVALEGQRLRVGRVERDVGPDLRLDELAPQSPRRRDVLASIQGVTIPAGAPPPLDLGRCHVRAQVDGGRVVIALLSEATSRLAVYAWAEGRLSLLHVRVVDADLRLPRRP